MKPTFVELVAISRALREHVDICAAEVIDLVHKETGSSITGPSVDKLRNKLAWHIAMCSVQAAFTLGDLKRSEK